MSEQEDMCNLEDTCGCEREPWEAELEKRIKEGIREAEQNPSDHRNSQEFRQIFDALQTTTNEGNPDFGRYHIFKYGDIVRYACDQQEITNENEIVLYQWMLSAHTNFWGLYSDHEISVIEKCLWKVHVGLHIIVSLLARQEHGGKYRRLACAVGKYVTKDKDNQKEYVDTFYSKLGPAILEELNQGPTEEFLEWLNQNG